MPQATTLFSTPEQGLKVRDSVSPQADAAPAADNTGGGGDNDHTGREAEVEGLLGIVVPHLYLITTGASHAEDTAGEEQAGKGGDAGLVQRMRLREFAGMPEGEIDAATSHALIAFSYHLTVGEMDEAHRAVKKIKVGAAQPMRACPVDKARQRRCLTRLTRSAFVLPPPPPAPLPPLAFRPSPLPAHPL